MEGCYPDQATCTNPNTDIQCDVPRCVCPIGQVVNPESNSCVDAATCGECIIPSATCKLCNVVGIIKSS